MANYYITNDNQILESTFSMKPRIGKLGGAKRLKFITAQSVAKQLAPHWHVQKVSPGDGKTCIITTASIFVADNNKVTISFMNARKFDSALEASRYIDDHEELVDSISNPIIINGDFTKVAYVKPIEEPVASDNTPIMTDDELHKRIIFPPEVRQKVWDTSPGICAICGKPITYKQFTIDHIKALARGGTNELSNLQVAHLYCNRMKNTMETDEFMSASTDITCNYIYHNPMSDSSLQAVRSMVRGMLQVSGFYTVAV